MSTAKEQAWAMTLKRTKHQQSGKHQAVSLEIQKKQIQEELTYFKQILRQALVDRNEAELDRATNKLVALRAKQVAIHLQEETNQGFTINSFILERAFYHYYHDCYRLVHSVRALRS